MQTIRQYYWKLTQTLHQTKTTQILPRWKCWSLKRKFTPKLKLSFIHPYRPWIFSLYFVKQQTALIYTISYLFLCLMKEINIGNDIGVNNDIIFIFGWTALYIEDSSSFWRLAGPVHEIRSWKTFLFCRCRKILMMIDFWFNHLICRFSVGWSVTQHALIRVLHVSYKVSLIMVRYLWCLIGVSLPHVPLITCQISY